MESLSLEQLKTVAENKLVLTVEFTEAFESSVAVKIHHFGRVLCGDVVNDLSDLVSLVDKAIRRSLE